VARTGDFPEENADFSVRIYTSFFYLFHQCISRGAQRREKSGGCNLWASLVRHMTHVKEKDFPRTEILVKIKIDLRLVFPRIAFQYFQSDFAASFGRAEQTHVLPRKTHDAFKEKTSECVERLKSSDRAGRKAEDKGTK
jgi:hypothetical protein